MGIVNRQLLRQPTYMYGDLITSGIVRRLGYVNIGIIKDVKCLIDSPQDTLSNTLSTIQDTLSNIK